MPATIPYRLANGPGNLPDAIKFMANYDWLGALLLGNPVLNPDFEVWLAATSFTNPANGAGVATSWTWRKSGTATATADVAREATTINTGTYSAKVTISAAGSSNSLLAFDQNITNPTFFKSLSVVVGFAVKVSTASKVRVKVTDGTTTAYSDYHTGGGSWETLRVKMAVGASVATLTVSLEITSDFTGDIYVDSSFTYAVPSLIDASAQEALAFIPQIAAFLSTVGGTMFGNLAMSGNKVTGLGAATTAGDALRYEQLYTALVANIPAAGFKLTGLGAGSAAGESVRYEQLKILQVVTATSETNFTTTSSTYQTTNCSAAITPTNAANKILIFAMGWTRNGAAATTNNATAIFRDATILTSGVGVLQQRLASGTALTNIDVPCTLIGVDTPGDTSAHTYSVKLKSTDNTTSVGFNATGGQTVIILVEVQV